MSAVDSGRDTSSADLLAEIMQQILINKAGKTADNSFTVTQIIPIDDAFDIDDSATEPIDRGLWFEITNDAGGGTTTALTAGKISWSVTTEYPTEWGQITDTNGFGAGVMKEGIIGTTVCITWMSSSGF